MHAVYLDVRRQFQNDKTQAAITHAFSRALRFFGDCCFTTISHDKVVEFARHLAGSGLRRGGIQNNLHLLHGGVKVFIKEYGLDIHNPFKTFHAKELWPDSARRLLVPLEELDAIRDACRRADDDIRWLLAILVDTGARVSEISGLALEDLRLFDDPPYVDIRVHQWRSLKTLSSRRQIPLIGSALWAAHRIVWSASDGQQYAFPRYFDGARHKEAAKSTLGLWLRHRDITGNLTSIRRAFADRLRVAGVPEDVRAALLGWRLIGMEEEYGIGFNLSTLNRWMARLDGNRASSGALLRTVGFDRALSLYECGLAVMRVIERLPYASFRNIVEEGTLTEVDVRRGLRYTLKHRSVALLHSLDGRHNPAYGLTGVSLARGSSAVRARKRSNPHAPTYDHRKLLLALPVPRKMVSDCFPNILNEPASWVWDCGEAFVHRAYGKLQRKPTEVDYAKRHGKVFHRPQ